MSKDKNPVFNALKLKARQLKKTGYTGPKAIILCDGGSQMVRSNPHGAFEFNFNAVDAAKDFLRQNQSVDFVIMLTSVLTSTSRFGPTEPPYRKVQPTLIPNKSFATLPDSIRDTVLALEGFFREPENTADGARETIRNKFDPKELRPLAGGLGVSSNQIKISASAVLGLLAGVVSQDALFENLGFKPQSSRLGAMRNPFQYQVNRGMKIDRVEVEHIDEADETYLTFHFGGRDPALTDFTNPKRSNN